MEYSRSSKHALAHQVKLCFGLLTGAGVDIHCSCCDVTREWDPVDKLPTLGPDLIETTTRAANSVNGRHAAPFLLEKKLLRNFCLK